MDLSNPSNLLIAGIYYVIVGILSFFSIFGVYILIRYGKSTLLSLGICLLYTFFYLKILADSYQALHALL